ncbi:hypothetical protein M426DRAFT_224654 [Hypoxylon sp. CI-4A]|nr:hypothetical protein M426DRAFT_224654 [Hypoxylon sp. CI-4A]
MQACCESLCSPVAVLHSPCQCLLLMVSIGFDNVIKPTAIYPDWPGSSAGVFCAPTRVILLLNADAQYLLRSVT